MLSPSTSALGWPSTNDSAEDEGLRQPVRAGLHAVADVDAPLRAVAQQRLEARRVLRRADEQDVADAGQHQRRQRVVDHRLVVHRQQLLAHGQRGRVQPGAGAAGEDDAFAVHAGLVSGSAASTSVSMRSTPSRQSGSARPKRAAQRARVQARVERAARRGREGAGRHGLDRVRRHLDGHARRRARSRSRGGRSRASWSRRRPPRGRCRATSGRPHGLRAACGR